MLFFPLKKNKNLIYGQNYHNYSLSDSITFFKFMMMTLCVNSFMTMITVIIQEESTKTAVAILAALTITDFLLFFQTQRLKPYIQHVLAALYIFYVASAIIVLISNVTGPLFLSGYGSGIIFCSIIQFCNPKVKLLFVLVTPWIFFAFTNVFILPYLHFIIYTLSASSLLGLLTYQFQAKQECIYSQSIISFDDRDSQFKLEFTNTTFEDLYKDDFKQILRMFQVVQDKSTTNQKRNEKFETLEEYLFQYNKDVQNCEENFYLKLKIKHLQQEKLQDITILRTYLNQPLFVISIKSTSANSEIEKYENKIGKLKDKLISISSDTGLFLQSQYHFSSQLIKSECLPIKQFKFTFSSDQQIENLERLLCTNKHQQNGDTEQVIISSVNYLILRTIGPYNEIYTRTYQTTDFDNYFNEISFYVYSDQTQLDDSYIKYNQVEREI